MKKKTALLAAVVATGLISVPATGYAKVVGSSSTTSTSTSTTSTSLLRPVSGNKPLKFDVNTTVGLACTQTGTEVGLALSADPAANQIPVSLKVAFTNPSVEWLTRGDYPTITSSGWYKKSLKTGAWQAATGDETSMVTLTPNLDGYGMHTKRARTTTGNPYVSYSYVDESGVQGSASLGHCNNGQGGTQVPLDHWTIDATLGEIGNLVHGSCVSSVKSSSASVAQDIDAAGIPVQNDMKVIYSNKVLSAPDSDGIITLADGVSTIDTSVDDSGFADVKGYHVWWETISVEGSIPPLDTTNTYDKREVHGIGGNPKVFLGIGLRTDEDAPLPGAAVSPYVSQGRCNQI